MNTEPESATPDTQNLPPGDTPIAPPDPSPDLSRPSEATDEPENNAAEANGSPHSNCRRKGNVARLPKAVRDQINVLIQDGVTYPGIIERLGEDGKGLSTSNVSRWKDGGYQDWLLEQNWLADTRARQESAADVIGDFDATQVNQAALQLGALHIFEALRKLGPGTLDQKLGGDSAAFARLINALARASKETLQLQKHRESCANARAAIQNLRDPKRKLTEEERRSLVLAVDDILGLPPDNDQSPMTNE
jgi:hypothetical protein